MLFILSGAIGTAIWATANPEPDVSGLIITYLFAGAFGVWLFDGPLAQSIKLHLKLARERQALKNDTSVTAVIDSEFELRNSREMSRSSLNATASDKVRVVNSNLEEE